MDEYLKLHQALSEAEVEYQKKFDAVKNFELGLLSKSINNVLQTLNEITCRKKNGMHVTNKKRLEKPVKDRKSVV